MSSHTLHNDLDGIEVNVEPQYLDQESVPEKNRFVFSYTVTITNEGPLAAKLMSRHWIITNGDNLSTQEVVGDGVIGQQPHIQPGESFTYTSGTVSESPVATMHGTYQMVRDDGEHFDVPIKPFRLAAPNRLH